MAGYLWVLRATPQGIANQIWEDSRDSHYHEDGTLFDFTRPYAPIAPRGYVYDALLGAADLLAAVPDQLPWTPDDLRRRGASLRTRVLAEVWQPDLGTFAQALTIEPDGALRPARVIASSPGHLLAGQILTGVDVTPIRARLIDRLLAPDMLAGAGIRTKSTTAARFRAGSY